MRSLPFSGAAVALGPSIPWARWKSELVGLRIVDISDDEGALLLERAPTGQPLIRLVLQLYEGMEDQVALYETREE